MRVEGTATPPSLTSTGHVPASRFLWIVAVSDVALANVVDFSTLLTQIRQPGTKLVPVQVSTVVPVPDAIGVLIDASAGLVVGDSVEACEAFGPAAIDAAVNAGPMLTMTGGPPGSKHSRER